ncbi:MAG TPA: PAS domain-containing protein, partial [Blastocatellia bacterium]|nr:PAS domain-containing protein [Blastocatellia bacterium]
AAEQFSLGNLSSRVGLGQGAGEFERIGYAFDEMAARLEKREQERNKLIAQLKQTNEELQTLLSIADDAMNSPNLDALLQVLLHRLLKIIKADAGAILLYEDDQLYVRASLGFGDDHSGFSIKVGEGFVGTIAATMRPLYTADAQSDERVVSHFIKQSGIRSMLGVPMKDRGKLIGVIHLDWMTIHPEDEHELRLLEITADRCAMSIVNQGLFESLKKNEERLRLAVTAGRMGTWDADLKTGRIAWSPVMEQILGFKPAEFRGTYEALLEIIHPEDRPGFIEAREKAIRGEAEYKMEIRFVKPDGQIYWGLLLGQVFQDEQGQPARLIGINLDITVRKQAEEALRQQAQIINNLHDSYVTTDLNGIITSWSNGAERTLGYSPQEIIGQHISLIYFADDHEFLQGALVKELFKTGHSEA